MANGKTGITNAVTARDGSGRTAQTALEAAAAKADVPGSQPTGGQQTGTNGHPPTPHQVSTVPGQGGQAPSGQPYNVPAR